MSNSLVRRMQGAAFLDVPTYEEVEHDSSATLQAAAVVLIAAVAEGIGGAGGGFGLLSGVIRWGLWAGITWFIGTRIFDGTADWGELLRTLGFAQAPAVLLILGIIPVVNILILPVVGVWLLVTALVAIRQALDISTGKAFLTALIGMIPYWILVGILL